MVGHAVDFDIIFRSEGEQPDSDVEAKLEFPQKDGGHGRITSFAKIEAGKVSVSFLFEAYGDLRISVARSGEMFFKETISLQK